MEVELPIQMAIHYLCSGLQKDKSTIEKLADVVSKKERDEIYMFLMALGSGLVGMSNGLGKKDKKFTKFTKKLCEKLNTDEVSTI